MADFDLAAARRARAEVEQEPIRITYNDQVFTCPPELDMVTGELIDSGKFREGYERLLNGQAEAFFALDLTFGDLRDLGAWLAQEYANRLQGESQASRSPSKPTSKSSRRPSKPTTRST